MLSRSGGERKDGNAILRPVTSRYWQTPGAAMDIDVGVGSTGFKRGFAIATASLFGFIPVGQLILAALLVLPLWKGAHHVRSLLIDLGG